MLGRPRGYVCLVMVRSLFQCQQSTTHCRLRPAALHPQRSWLVVQTAPGVIVQDRVLDLSLLRSQQAPTRNDRKLGVQSARSPEAGRLGDRLGIGLAAGIDIETPCRVIACPRQ